MERIEILYEGPHMVNFNERFVLGQRNASVRIELSPFQNAGVVFRRDDNTDGCKILPSIMAEPTLNTTKVQEGPWPSKAIKVFMYDEPGTNLRVNWRGLWSETFAVYEHLMASMFAKGIHKYLVEVKGTWSPPQPYDRESTLAKLIDEVVVSKEGLSFDDVYDLNKLTHHGSNGGRICFAPLDDDCDGELVLEAFCDYNGIESRQKFVLGVDDYSDIASARTYSPLRFLAQRGQYVGRNTQEEVDEIAKHTLVDGLGLVALMANTLKTRIRGKVQLELAGHKTQVEGARKLLLRYPLHLETASITNGAANDNGVGWF